MVYISNSMQSLVSLDVRAMQLQRGVNNFTQRNTRRENSIGQDTATSLDNYDSDIKALTSSINSITSFTNRLEQSRDVWDFVGDKLNRMDEIINYANDTYGGLDPASLDSAQTTELEDLQLEINQILTDIRDTVQQDTYQGESLLGGNYEYNTRVGLESNNYFNVDFKGEELEADIKKIYTGGGPDNIGTSLLGSNLVTTNSFVITSGPEADNRLGAGDTNIADKDGRIYVYNRSNTSTTSTLALNKNDQLSNSYIDLELGYRMDAYESGGTAFIVASTADNADYQAQGGSYNGSGDYVNGDAVYDQNDVDGDGIHNEFVYYDTETNKIDPDGSFNLYTADELKEGSDYDSFTTDGITYHMGGVAKTDANGTTTLTYDTGYLNGQGGVQVEDIYSGVVDATFNPTGDTIYLTYTEEMLDGTNVLNDGTGTSGMETSALYGTRIAQTENDGTTILTYDSSELGADGFDTNVDARFGEQIDRTYLKKNDGVTNFTYDSAVFAAEVAAGDTSIADQVGYDTNADGTDDVFYNRSYVLTEDTSGVVNFSGGETVYDENGVAVTYSDYIFDSNVSNTYDVDEGNVDLSRQVNAGGDSSSDYFGQNLISTVANSNFAGALTAGETVDILDTSGDVIHTFSGDEAGNDVVMEVHGGSGYIFKDDIPSPSVDTANIDFSRVANAGGNSSSTYYDKNIISTVVDSNFSGALDSGVTVEVLDSSNNIIHRFSGDEAGNDVVMEVNGGASYNVVNTNTPNTPDIGDIDYSREANAAGNTGSSYYGQNVISTVADSNFSGPLASGETVQVLDSSNNVIHEFQGGIAGNDIVMQVEGAASYNIGNSNAIADPDSGNIDYSREANAGGNTGSTYYDQNVITTVADSNFSGPLAAGEKVRVLDSSNNVIHEFEGGVTGNDMVMEVVGAASYEVENTNAAGNPDSGNIDYSREANAGGNTGSTYYDQNVITTVADSNFSGPLVAGEKVRVLDSSNNVIHEFEGGVTGNDMVMEVVGAVSYEVENTNAAGNPDSGNIDYSREANAGGNTGSTYYDQNVITTVADSNFSGPLAAGEKVRVLDSSNNVIHEFEGGVTGNDMVMEVVGAASYEVENTNVANAASLPDIDPGRQANAGGNTGSTYYNQNLISTVADVNFSGPLDSGVSVEVRDSSDNIIHTFSGDEAGNDVVMEVLDGASYTIVNTNTPANGDGGSIDYTREANAGGNTGSSYYEQNVISTVTDSNFSGPLDAGVSVEVRDSSNNIIHTFQGGIAGNDVVMQVEGAASFTMVNTNTPANGDSGDIDYTREANAGGNTGSDYYGENRISTIADSNFSGPLDVGVSVEVRDSSNNIIHTFQGGTAGNDVVMQVEGAAAFTMVNTNTPANGGSGDIDYTREANAGGNTGSVYHGENRISTIADSNFSGPLSVGVTVQVLDGSNNVIHQFEGGVSGNDVVMQVEGAVSYNIENSNAIADPDSGNIDYSREANAGGNAGSNYYGESRIGTVADANFSGPLSAGVKVQVLDGSNNIIHEFEGGVSGNDVVMQVEGAVSYNIENTNSAISASVGDIDISKSLNAGGDSNSQYFEMERMTDNIETQYGDVGVLQAGEELKVYDDSNNLMHVFSATETVYAIAGASWVEYTNDTTDTNIVSNEINLSRTVNGDAPYNGQNLLSTNAVKDDDGNDVVVQFGFTVEMRDSSNNLIHTFNAGDTVFEVEGAVEMVHSLGDDLTHQAGEKMYHVAGDSQYIKDGDTKYHKAGDAVYQKNGDVIYHDVDDNETHKIGDQKFFEVNTDVNGTESHGGSAYVFRTNGSTTQRVELVAPPSVTDGDRFGEEVAIAGDTALVYSQGDQKIYVYTGVDTATGTLNHSDTIDVSGLNVTSLSAIEDGGRVYAAVGSSNGAGQLDIYKANGAGDFGGTHLTLTGENTGDNFGSSVTFHKNSNGALEVAVAASGSDYLGTDTGRLYLHYVEAATVGGNSYNKGDGVINEPGDFTFQNGNTNMAGRHITVTDDYIAATDEDETVTVWERATGDLLFKNSASVAGGIGIQGNDLYLADPDVRNVVELDLLTQPKYHLLDPTLAFDSAGYGLSSFLGSALDTLAVSTNIEPLVNRNPDGTLKGSFTSAARHVNGLDVLNMDVVLKNFNVMNQSFESSITRLKSETTDLIEEKDKMTQIETDDTQLVSNVLDTVYGESGVNNIMNIMNPFDLTLVSSLLP